MALLTILIGHGAPASAQANDNFANATVLGGTSGSINGDNTAATGQTNEPDFLDGSAGNIHSLWYRFTAPSNGTLRLETTVGNYDTTIAVYTGTAVNNLVVVGADDDSGAGTLSLLTVNVTSGTIYRIRVDGFSGSRGTFTLSYLFTAATPALSVTTTNNIAAAGTIGGPFNFSTPSPAQYLVQNTGGGTLNWSLSSVPTWLTVSPSTGSLGAGASQTVTLSVNASANTLGAGTQSGTNLIFNGGAAGTATRTASLTVNKGASITTITSDTPDPSVVGQPYTVSVTVGTTSASTLARTGNVTISDGSASCVATLSGSAGSCALTSTTPGTKTLTASYPGDVNYNASSGTAGHVVNKGNTTTTITSDTPDPSVFGQPYTVTASVAVAAPAVGTPTGTFTISDGVLSCVTPAIAGGSASCAIPGGTPPGGRTLTATYNGDANFNTSTGTAAHQIDKAATTTAITSDTPDPSFVGQSFSVSATVSVVSPGAGTPTGLVSFTDGSDGCSAPVDGAGTATCTINGTTAGTKTLTATYVGDANFATSSGTAPHTINPGSTTTAVADAPDPTVSGQSYTVTATVAAVAPAIGIPSGTVNVTDGTNNCTLTLAGGTGSCALATTAVGAATVTATYLGDGNFATSSNATPHTVNKADTTTAVTSDTPDPTVFGQPYTVSVTVGAVAPGIGTPTGSVTVGDGSATCNVTLAGGSGSCLLASAAAPGTATVSASYGGDPTFNASTSTGVPHDINKGGSTTTITADTPDPSVFGQSYNVSVTVAAVAPAAGTPGGQVTISDGQGHSCNATLAGGAGTCAISGTAVGAATLTATYPGDASFDGSTDTEAHTVSKGDTAVTITSDAPDPSVAGQPYTVAVTVAPTGGAAGTPGGTVNVDDGQGHACAITLAGGSGSCALNGTAVGGATLTASYAGDASFNANSDTEPHTVGQGGTVVTITSDAPDASVFGQPYTVAVTVAAAAPATGTPTGTVAVDDGQGHTCSITLAGGAGSCVLNGTAVGAATITASYSGDASFTTNADTEAHTVNQGATVTTITSDAPDPSVFGQAYTVAVTVAPTGGAAGTPSGTVNVDDGQGHTCAVTLAGGSGSCALNGTAVGAATITATYAGDTNFTGSGDTEDHTVGQGATTTTITSDAPDASVFGQPYTVAVTVAATGGAAGTPSGTVAVDDGQGHTCSITLAGGTGSCALNGTAVGAATITATYAGDANFTGSLDTEGHTVNQGSSTTTITSDAPDASVFGQAYTVAVTVAASGGAAGTPGGTVAVDDGQGHTCSITLAGGAGSCALNGTAVGPATITASYSGDGSFTASSDTEAHTVGQGATTTTITSDLPDPSAFGQAYTVAVTVAPTGGAAGTPGGTVAVNDGQGHTCSITLSGGAGNCVLNGTAVGPATLTAVYSGDASFSASNDTEAHTVNQGGTTTTITSDTPDPSIFGQPYTVTVAVAPAGAAAGTPTGTVTISDGAHSCTTPALSSGTASCVLNNTAVGAATLTATYAGDGSFSGSADTEPHSVQQIPTTVSLTSSVNPSLEGQPVTFTATVAPSTATGTVTFRDGSTVIGTAPVGAGGIATLQVSTLGAGAHSITAAYGGDTNHATKTSAAVAHRVTANGRIVLAVAVTEGNGTFSFSSPTAALGVSVATAGGSGQSAPISLNPGSYAVTVTPPDGFGLTGVACSDSDSRGNVGTKSAQIVLAPAETVTCTFSSANSRKKTVEVISQFMSRRADMLLSNGPDTNRQIDRLMEVDGEGGGNGGGGSAGFAGSGKNGSGFASSSAGPSRAGGEAIAFGAGGGKGGSKRSFEDRLSEISGGTGEPREEAAGISPFLLSGSNDAATRLSFATSLSQFMRYRDESEARRAKLDGIDGAMGLGALAQPSQKLSYSPFDIWLEGHYFRFSDDRDRSDSDGHFGVLYLGADYVVSPRLLVGALVQFDSMEQSSTRDAYRIEGRGWMAGPYATLRLTDRLFLQGRAAWGRSDNDVSPFMTYTDTFETERWLVSSTLTGRWQYGALQVRPSATLAFIEDRSESYIDGLGVAIPGMKVSLGQFKAGPEFSYRFEAADGTILEPRLTAEAIWNFSASDQVADFGGTLSGPEELRGRIELGIKAKLPSGIGLDLSGSYDGIGSDDFHAIGGKATVRMPLN